MSNFGGKNVQNLTSAGASSQTQFEELTALPLTPWLHLRGPISKGGWEWEGRVMKEKGRVEKRSLPPAPQSSPQIDISGLHRYIILSQDAV